jgi:hypothetical protein
MKLAVILAVIGPFVFGGYMGRMILEVTITV